MLVIHALKKTYKDQVVLDIPKLLLPEGKIIGIYGHNGSGKTTLAKILAGIVKKDDQKDPLPGRKVGYMTQRPLAFKMSVKNNLMLNADKACSRQEQIERAKRLLEELQLESIADKNAAKLSGGQTQRMALARVLMKDYDVLILDEPTASVDAEAISLCEKQILKYHERTGCTILIITHAKEQARRLSDEIIYLENGAIAEAKV